MEVGVGLEDAGEGGLGVGQVAGLLGQGALGVGQAQVVVAELGRPAGVAADQAAGGGLAEVAVGRGGHQQQLGGRVRFHLGAVDPLEQGDRPFRPAEGPLDVGQHGGQVLAARDALRGGQLGRAPRKSPIW